MYNLDHLRMLVETVETGSFSACARKLGKVQSAISQGIAALEVDLNVELFDRTTRKPTLTENGSRVLEFARSILRQADDLKTATDAMLMGEEAQIRLALDSALVMPQITKIYHTLSEKFPMTEFELLSIASPDISELVKTGRVDIGLIFSEVDINKDVDQCFIGNLPFFAVCAVDHPLAKNDKILTNDLIPHRQLMLRGESGAGLDLFPKMSTLAWYSNDFHTLCSMVLDGFGWSYVPAHFAEQWIENGKAHRMNLAFDHKPWSPPIEVVTPKTSIGPITNWLVEELKKLLDG